MLRYKLFKVREGKLEALKNWSAEMKEREPEVIDTLRYENVMVETMYTFTVGNECFAMGMQIIEGEHRKADMSVDINKQHFAVLKECLEPYNGEILYDFAQIK